MKTVGELIVSILVLWSVGTLSIRAVKKIELLAKTRIQQGLSPLTNFTRRLTCVELTKTGQILPSKGSHCQNH